MEWWELKWLQYGAGGLVAVCGLMVTGTVLRFLWVNGSKVVSAFIRNLDAHAQAFREIADSMRDHEVGAAKRHGDLKTHFDESLRKTRHDIRSAVSGLALEDTDPGRKKRG